VTFPDNVAVGMTYNFRVDGVVKSHFDFEVSKVIVNSNGNFNTANLDTSDTYVDFQGPHETAEILTVGNGGGKIQRIDANGNPVDFLTVTSGFQGCFGVAGK